MQLFLLRHGDAEPFRTDDASRALTPAGEEQSNRAGKFLQSRGVQPDLIFHSPLLRAKQTASLIHTRFPSAAMKETEHLTPSSDQRQLLQEFNGTGYRNAFFCVGHEPFLSALISFLSTGSRNAHIAFGTGSLACLHISLPFEPESGKLLWLLPNEMLRMEG